MFGYQNVGLRPRGHSNLLSGRPAAQYHGSWMKVQNGAIQNLQKPTTATATVRTLAEVVSPRLNSRPSSRKGTSGLPIKDVLPVVVGLGAEKSQNAPKKGLKLPVIPQLKKVPQASIAVDKHVPVLSNTKVEEGNDSARKVYRSEKLKKKILGSSKANLLPDRVGIPKNEGDGKRDLKTWVASLPSQNPKSMLEIWNAKRLKWTNSKSELSEEGEKEFLEKWRKCRTNPEDYGIKISPPQEFPKLKIVRFSASREPSPPSGIYGGLGPKCSLVKSGKKPNSDLECKGMRQRFEDLRCLYPNLLPLTGYESRTKAKLKIRLQQAEDWHHVMNYQPDEYPHVNSFRIPDQIYEEHLRRSTPRTPRYAANTQSSLKKITPFKFY